MDISESSMYLDFQDLALSGVFVLGYLGIIFEEFLAFNKSGVGLLMAVTLWVIRSIGVSFLSSPASSYSLSSTSQTRDSTIGRGDVVICCERR